MRIEVEDKISKLKESDKEMMMKLKDTQRKLVAYEYLILNVNLLILVPDTEQRIVMETLEDIEEMKECFNNLGLTSSPQKKRKNSEQAKTDEAKSVLIDLLTSMLAKPQSFLREAANQCFKNFCVDSLDESSLARLLGIVGTANKEAGEFMEPEQDAEESDENDELAEISSDG